jgi:hypothetical protein
MLLFNLISFSSSLSVLTFLSLLIYIILSFFLYVCASLSLSLSQVLRKKQACKFEVQLLKSLHGQLLSPNVKTGLVLQRSIMTSQVVEYNWSISWTTYKSPLVNMFMVSFLSCINLIIDTKALITKALRVSDAIKTCSIVFNYKEPIKY